MQLTPWACQKEIAKQIVAGKGDYVLAVKGNQERLLEDVQATVQKALEGGLPAQLVSEHTTSEKGHGREEQRTYTVVNDVAGIRDRKLWTGLKTVIMCGCERTINGQTTSEVRYFIGSRKMGARRYAQVLRGHWGIENNLHWQLDISFGEDDSHIQDRNGAANFALMRKIALGLLKRHPHKDSIARKRKLAALDLVFHAEVIAGAAKVEKI